MATKEKPLTPERREALMYALDHMIRKSDESPVDLAWSCRWFLGEMLYKPTTFATTVEEQRAANVETERRAASDPVVLAMVTEALKRGGVLG